MAVHRLWGLVISHTRITTLMVQRESKLMGGMYAMWFRSMQFETPQLSFPTLTRGVWQQNPQVNRGDARAQLLNRYHQRQTVQTVPSLSSVNFAIPNWNSTLTEDTFTSQYSG